MKTPVFLCVLLLVPAMISCGDGSVNGSVNGSVDGNVDVDVDGRGRGRRRRRGRGRRRFIDMVLNYGVKVVKEVAKKFASIEANKMDFEEDSPTESGGKPDPSGVYPRLGDEPFASMVKQSSAAVVRAETNKAMTDLRGIHEAAEMFQLINAQTELLSLRQLYEPDESGKRWLIVSSEPPQDPWGHAYVLRKAASGKVEILSIGPDGVLGTDDDLVHPSPQR